MEKTNIYTIYDGIVDNLKGCGAEDISKFGEQIVSRWVRRSALMDGGIDPFFELKRGIIMRHEDKLVALALGKIDGGNCLYNPLRLQFGAQPDPDGNFGKILNGQADDLCKIINHWRGDWAFGEFEQVFEGEGVEARGCWANDSLFGGNNSKSINVDLACEIVARTIKNGLNK